MRLFSFHPCVKDTVWLPFLTIQLRSIKGKVYEPSPTQWKNLLLRFTSTAVAWTVLYRKQYLESDSRRQIEPRLPQLMIFEMSRKFLSKLFPLPVPHSIFHASGHCTRLLCEGGRPVRYSAKPSPLTFLLIVGKKIKDRSHFSLDLDEPAKQDQEICTWQGQEEQT
jgi:hypothetical protein